MSSLLTFENVHCWKGNGANRKEIIRDLSFSLDSGGIATLLGPSGSGKSTVLRLAVGLDEFASGRIWFHGRTIQEWDIRELRRRTGMVFQLPFLFPGTVKDNLLYAPRIHQRMPADESAFVRDLLAQVGLPPDLLSRSSTELSVGQQMRISLARTLANHPEILLLDEPASALDPKAAAHLLGLIRQLNREKGYTVLCVTHQLDFARALGGRFLLLQDGRLTLDGRVEELDRHVDTAAWRMYLEGQPDGV